jgi:uncharacterized LabA/DUF88 family protein
MKRIAFLIDGFNVYHSTLAIQAKTRQCTKWLNLGSLCSSYVPLWGKDARLADIFYFSAPPHYLSAKHPDKIIRFNTYVQCLHATGITVELARFKQKEVFCDSCRTWILKHEEKETDIAIAMRTVELLVQDRTDVAVIVSGDTDFSPVVHTCLRLYPAKSIVFAFPYARKNEELVKITKGSFSIRRKQYVKHQFPNPFVLPDGTEIHKPSTW